MFPHTLLSFYSSLSLFCFRYVFRLFFRFYDIIYRNLSLSIMWVFCSHQVIFFSLIRISFFLGNLQFLILDLKFLVIYLTFYINSYSRSLFIFLRLYLLFFHFCTLIKSLGVKSLLSKHYLLVIFSSPI